MDVVDLKVLPDGSMLARAGGEQWTFGEPYEIMVLVSPIYPWWLRPPAWCVMIIVRCMMLFVTRCEIQGLDRRPTKGQWLALKDALKQRRLVTMEFDRNKGGVVRRHRQQL